MKKNTKLLIVAGMVFAMIIGYLIGTLVDYPDVNKNSVAGTISKINNYRNSQLTPNEVELKNELASDTAKLKQMRSFLSFHYYNVLKTQEEIKAALNIANAESGFKAKNENVIKSLESYNKYLSSARTDLLLALSALTNPKETNPIILRDLINQTNNVIAQCNYRNRGIGEMIDALSEYVKEDKSGKTDELKRIHDILMLNQINVAVLTGNKSDLKDFGNKPFLSDSEKLQIFDKETFNNLIVSDMEKLSCLDLEKLGIEDAEKLGTLDKEKLGTLDKEKLGAFDKEKLGLIFFDAELQAGYSDKEDLGIYNDKDNLNLIYIHDKEKLGLVNDKEKLNHVVIEDAEKFGSFGMYDSETLGSLSDWIN